MYIILIEIELLTIDIMIYHALTYFACVVERTIDKACGVMILVHYYSY